MFSAQINNQAKIKEYNNPVIWFVFFLYIAALSYNFAHHQLWADELHSWNIAKGSTTFFNAVYNTRYEGHPPLWYIMLWGISKFSHNMLYMQLLQAFIAVAVMFVILFFSPFSTNTKVLIPFGYFFMFEYGVLSRNYAIGILLCVLICVIINREFKYKIVVYYLLLFLLSNVHLLSLILATCLHLYFLLGLLQKKQYKILMLHAALGCVIFLPSVYFIIPPSESELNIAFITRNLQEDRVLRIFQLPLRAFMPIPELQRLTFWNTQFLFGLGQHYFVLKLLYPIVSCLITLLAFVVLTKDMKAWLMFAANLFFSIIVTFVFFPLNTERYSGFVFITFLVCIWLYDYKKGMSKGKKNIITLLLCLQIIGSLVVTVQTTRYPFSNSYRVGEIMAKIPANEKAVTDYWALNTVAAYTDKPFYCIDLQREASFILWGPDMKALNTYPYKYYRGSYNFMHQNNLTHFYLVSVSSLKNLSIADTKFLTAFHVELIAKIEGAIEPDSNLYLYKISNL